ncbi:alpha/beta hydrolase [Actinomycetospora endophytica]|uniref:Alpha/beta hydrolase n=1 Tax=Actinomycetospora endophytica TaxID=2291215 RepID=A0ABS8PE88_9PSEU|nr:alpha/beta hydrolase [Actinomycetospora endophytica]MCD2196598.1 alpha/beta hydrolase [Actinomycetospora endophytica]
MTTSAGPRRGRRLTGAAAGLALVVLGFVGLTVLLVALGALVPGLGALSGWATVTVPARGATLVVAGLVAAVLALLLRRRLRWAATGVAIGTGVATVALAVVVGISVVTTVAAGGSVNPFRAVVPSSGLALPDGDPVYTTGPDGAALHAAVWDPRGATGPAPVLVYVHGGGWNAGSELGNTDDLRWFADHGRLVVSVAYTLSSGTRPTWDVAGPEVACALTKVAALAPGRGGDPSRIVLAGDSAGGQLAVSVGYHAASGTQPSSCGGTVPVPRGVLVQYPAVDLVDAYEHGHFPGQPGTPAGYLGQLYTGGTPEQVPDRYAAVSGGPAITPRAPATLVIGPTRDELVPPGGVERFVDQARAAGVDATLVRMPYANHAYDTLGTGSLGNQARLTISEHWLADHGW